MNRSIAQTYRLIRRGGRFLITSSPFLDRIVGDPLRKLERQHVPVDHLCASLATNQVACHGLELYFPLHDVGTVSSILLYEDYEPVTRKVIQDFLEPGMTFVDLGANIGYFTLLGARAVAPNGKVYSFEPIPSTFRFLEKNVAANNLGRIVTAVENAVSNTHQFVRFSFDESNSVSASIQTGVSQPETNLEIEAVSLDEFFSSLGWPDVHLVKMDIEGAELAAMEGMRELSERNPQLKLIFEFLYQNLVQNDIQPEHLFNTLRDLGFNRFRVLHNPTWVIEFPVDIPKLVALAKRVNLNILAEKS